MRNVTPTVLVISPLDPGDAVGNGDESLLPQGRRGEIMDRFFELQRVIDLAADVAQLALGQPPGADFNTLLTDYLAGLADANPATPTLAQTDELFLAYLRQWSGQIDSGIAHWSELGLAIAKGLFDAGPRRQIQNDEGANVGIDVDPSRADIELEVGLVDVMLDVLKDPNQDDDFSDSFIRNHLLPMFGVPPEIAGLQVIFQTFAEFLNDNIVGLIRLAFNPISEALDEIKEIPKAFLKTFIRERWGFDIDQLEQLLSLSNKIDVASITVGSRTIPVFKPADHENLDHYLGIEGIALSQTLQDSL